MKNKTFYSIITLCIAFIGFSCTNSEDDQNNVLAGIWNYQSPHFAFEYSEDSIAFDMGMGGKKSLSAEDLNSMFYGMAQEKMGAYFNGIQFVSANELKVRMQMASGDADSLKATYIGKGDIIEIELDTTDLGRINGKTMNIPKISFKYTADAEQMTMYFDKSYVTMLWAMMHDQLLDMMIPMMIDIEQVPERARDAMLAAVKVSFKAQIDNILDKTQKIEIGMIFKR